MGGGGEEWFTFHLKRIGLEIKIQFFSKARFFLRGFVEVLITKHFLTDPLSTPLSRREIRYFYFITQIRSHLTSGQI